MYELTIPIRAVPVSVEEIAAVIKQMTTADLNRLFELVPSLQNRPLSDISTQTDAAVIGDMDKITDEMKWQTELRQLKDDLRQNHPFAKMSRDEMLKQLRQTREEVYDELYGDMYEN